MKKLKPPKATKAERAYIRHLKRVSVFDMLDQGKAEIVSPADYPEPVKRFLERERRLVHVHVPAALKRRLEAQSKKTGVPVEKLARRWIEQGIKRDAS